MVHSFSQQFLLRGMGGEFIIGAFPKSGVKCGVFLAVYMILLAFFMGGVLSTPVDAAELVSNLGQTDSIGGHVAVDNNGHFHAQSFTVGDSDYFLEKVVVSVATLPSAGRRAFLSIHEVDSDSNPGVKLYDLNGTINSTGEQDFTAPYNAFLNANTTYFLLVKSIHTSFSAGAFYLTAIYNTTEDSGAAAGWSIGNSRYDSIDRGDNWSLVSQRNLKFAVHGVVKLPVLIGNINSPTNSYGGHTLSGGVFVAQGFTTGNHSNGYDVSRIMVKVEEASTREPVVSIYSSNDKKLGTKLYDFNGSVTATGNRFFTASVDVILSPDTSYFVRISGRGGGSFKVARGRLSTNGPDSGSLSDWSLMPFVFLDSGNPNPELFLRFSVRGLPRSSPLPDVNHVPVFSGSANFSVNENNKTVGTVVASDSDIEDNITDYKVSGGADSSRFSINTTSGVLSFKSAPNYENPSDSGKNNEYVVEVTVKGGSSGRERFTSRTFTVRVVNVVEIPSVPNAPGLTSLNSTSLFVDWFAPSNTGPSIIDYDVGYGLNSGGPFTDWPHSSAGRSAVITGLSASTLYYVRVLARTAEGNSSWSRTSAFVTDSATVLPVNSSVLVSNINRGLAVGGRQITNTSFVAQQFTTGNHSNGYTVSSVVVKIEDASSTRVPVVSIYSSDGSRPVTKLYEFSGSVTESGDRVFTVPVGVTLSPNTRYFVHIAGGTGSGFFRVRHGSATDRGFESGGAPRWSISNFYTRSTNGGSSWDSWSVFLLRFSVWGAERSGPVPDVNHVPFFSGSATFSVNENNSDCWYCCGF